MLKFWLLLLCATGIRSLESEIPTSRFEGNETIRRFACPIGFFRLRRFCYYLSAGTATWRDAYFHCKDRNASLAILDRNGKEKMLRKYLMGEQFTKLERWIGGIFNWEEMAWLWGVTGERMDFQNFGEPVSNNPSTYAWHCIVMDPRLRYKWSPKSCMQRKHYVCEVPAGRIGRRRKKTTDPFAPQNQRLKPRKKGNKLEEYWKDQNKRKKGKQWKKDRRNRYEYSQWAHGVNLGSRPPSRIRKENTKKRVHNHLNRTETEFPTTKLRKDFSQQKYHAFSGGKPENRPQGLSPSDVSKVFPFLREEVLLKP